MSTFKDKKYILLFCLLLFLLVLPRIVLYPVFGEGIVGTDAERRYLPQATELLQSFDNFLFQISPAYSLFLLFFKKIGVDIVACAVLVQHIIGIITAFLVFHYFKKINLFLAAFTTVFVYSGWLALWVEHTILRESLSAFFFVLLVLLFTIAIKKEEYFRPCYAFLTGLIGLILVFFRLEFILLVVLFPLIFLFTRKEKLFSVRKFLKWNLGYFLPIFVVFLVCGAIILGDQKEEKLQYGFLFGLSYHSMAYHDFLPKIFYYQNSCYPELLEKYQSALEADQERKIAGTPDEVTEKIQKLMGVGVTQLICGSPLGKDIPKAIKLIGKSVMPAFKG